MFEENSVLNVKRFDALSEEWLEFIKENRSKGGLQHKYDVIIGPAAVLYFRYDQDHERESCTSDVPCTSGAEKRTVGRTLVEPVLLCRDRQ